MKLEIKLNIFEEIGTKISLVRLQWVEEIHYIIQ